MNKAELIDAVTARLGVDKRTANSAVEAILDTVQRAVAKGEKVAITGFGVFERIERPARMGRNPATGEQVRLKKTAVPKFRPGTEFKGVVSGARKLAKVADAATKAAARSVSDSAARTARTAAAAPGKAASAAGKAANRAGGGRKSATSRSTARPAKAASKATTKKTTARKTATKRAG